MKAPVVFRPLKPFPNNETCHTVWLGLRRKTLDKHEKIKEITFPLMYFLVLCEPLSSGD